MPKGDENRLFGSMSDVFLANKGLSDPNMSEIGKELAFRLRAAHARIQLANVPEPIGLTRVSTSGAGPAVQPGDQILALDGQWKIASKHEIGTAIDRYVRVARDLG